MQLRTPANKFISKSLPSQPKKKKKNHMKKKKSTHGARPMSLILLLTLAPTDFFFSRFSDERDLNSLETSLGSSRGGEMGYRYAQ
jgi:hypothetical protein